MYKRLVENMKALRIYAVMCSLSLSQWFDIFALITFFFALIITLMIASR